VTEPGRLWARLTWQARDPDALAIDLARRLAVDTRPGGLVPGARLLDLGTAWLELRPWVREGPVDHPRTAGRLMLEPVPDGEVPPGTSPALELVGLGWATVESDRAEAELAPWLGPRAGGEPLDETLGARARLRAGGGLPGSWTVILEPVTEGRAAASLARDGEGPCALYLAPAVGIDAWSAAARARGVTVGGPRPGPLGRQVLLAGGAHGPGLHAAGPHVIVTEAVRPMPDLGPAGTIAS
jgi:hypothetical protein